VPPPPVCGAPVGNRVAAGVGVWLGCVVAFCDAGARAVEVAFDVDEDEVFPVDEGEPALVPVCELVDVADGE
jgi:hypothetical protein